MKIKEMKRPKMKTIELTLCGLFTALIAIGAFIQIPLPYMDYFTLQFFFVILSGMILGPRLGMISVTVYVAIGLVGIPIFAAGGGIGYVLKPSFGYLIGFIAASFVVGTVLKLSRNKRYHTYLLAALGGFLVTYVIGLLYKYLILNLYLGEPMPWSLILLSCFPVDIPCDLILCVVAAFLGRRLDLIKWEEGK